MITQTSVSASISSGAAINPNTAFMAMMALGKKGDDKVTTMERMALFFHDDAKTTKNRFDDCEFFAGRIWLGRLHFRLNN